VSERVRERHFGQTARVRTRQSEIAREIEREIERERDSFIDNQEVTEGR
jgi:hypothetical protein